MSRRAPEQAVIDRFVDHIARETGLVWHPSPDEVPNLKNSRKPDCEFTCPGQVPIVADICSLFPLGSHQHDQAKRAKFIERLLPELSSALLAADPQTSAQAADQVPESRFQLRPGSANCMQPQK